MSLAGLVAGIMLAVLIGWVGIVLYATFRQLDGEGARRSCAGPELVGFGADVRMLLGRRRPIRRRARRRRIRAAAPATTSASVTALEHLADVRPQRDPHLPQRPGAVAVLELIGRLAAHRRERPLDRPHDLGNRDLIGGAAEPVPAVRARPTSHEPLLPQLAEDVPEERVRDVLRLRDRLALRRRGLRRRPAPQARSSPSRRSRLWRRRAWGHSTRPSRRRALEPKCPRQELNLRRAI